MNHRPYRREWPRMTDDQRKLVEENHGLIYQFLHDYNLGIEDWYDVAAIGMCKAAIEYDQSKAKFSSMAYRCMRNEVFHELYLKRCPKRSPEMEPVSLNDSVCDGSYELMDTIPSETDFTGASVDEIMGSLNERDRHDVKMLAAGYTGREIGKMYGQSHGAFPIRLKRIRRELAEFSEV